MIRVVFPAGHRMGSMGCIWGPTIQYTGLKAGKYYDHEQRYHYTFLTPLPHLSGVTAFWGSEVVKDFFHLVLFIFMVGVPGA